MHSFCTPRALQNRWWLRLSSVLNLPVGFSNSLVPTLPADYQGIRWLLRNHGFDLATLWLALILVVVGSWVGWTVRRLALVWGNLERHQHLALACCALVLAFDFGTLIFWDPLYDKLWLQPLAAIFVAWSIIFSAWRRLVRSWLMLIPEASLLTLLIVTGATEAFEANRSPTPCLPAAEELGGMLRPVDLLVSGWDPASLLYGTFWGMGAQEFSLPSAAGQYGAGTSRLLSESIAATRKRGGEVYFLGVLDTPKSTWEPFLGEREHLRYESLEPLRRCASPVTKLVCSSGRGETLWQLPDVCPMLWSSAQ